MVKIVFLILAQTSLLNHCANLKANVFGHQMLVSLIIAIRIQTLQLVLQIQLVSGLDRNAILMLVLHMLMMQLALLIQLANGMDQNVKLTVPKD